MDVKERLMRLSPQKRSLLALRLSRKQANGDAQAGGRELAVDKEGRFQPFPLTDLQQAYWIGRSGGFDIGNVASHSYLEFESEGLDIERLAEAWRQLIDRHDMLRAVILPDGKQQILESVPPYQIQTLDLRNQSEFSVSERLRAVRDELSHQVLPVERWPLFDIRAARLDGRKLRLFVSFDALIVDAWSMSLLFREWSHLYHRPQEPLPELTVSFRDYVLAEQALQQSEGYARSRAYWLERIQELPGAPDLPTAINPSAIEQQQFVRRVRRLEPELWQRLKARAAKASLTAPGVLMAAYVETLGLWSKTQRFTINVPRFNRLPLHPQVNDLVGEFASFTLLEADLTQAGGFESRARRLQEQLWRDLNHSDFGGIQILRELAQQRRGNVLMPVVFTSLAQDQRAAANDADQNRQESFPGNVVYSINQTSQVWLDNHVSEKRGALVCEWDSVDKIFPDGVPEEMLHAYFRLLESLATDEHAWNEPCVVTAARLLPPDQREQRARIQNNAAPIPDLLAHDLFAQQAQAHPEKPAVIAGDRTLTYDELYRFANRIGRRLRGFGARPNQTIAIAMEKGWEQIAAALGIAQSGAAYLPVDTDVPRERLHQILENGEVQIVLTQSWVDGKIDWPGTIRRICVDSEDWNSEDDTPLESQQTPDDLLYVLYTSGSTGNPKGVMIAHRGVVNSVVQTNQTFGINESDSALALTALHHDMSVYDIFGVLGAGGSIVMPSPAGRRDPAHWMELLERHQVTLWNSVPAMMEMLLELSMSRTGKQLPALRWAFLGGDWIQVSLPERLKQLAPGARVVSVGGPTETTLWNIWHPVDSLGPDWRSIPYGTPIANTKYYVLNDVLAECPTWVPGELCCAGVGLAKGYWRDDEKTRAKFIAHPLTGERMYRTGDLGRYRRDGTLEFLGRVDFQVKLQGQRIELGEIEAALQQHPAIRVALVVAAGDPQGKKRLVAYVVPKEQGAALNGELRGFLQSKLPDYMVPSAFVTLPSLPLTANGKVNRRDLPLPEETPAEPAEQPKPEVHGTAAKIAAIAAKILDLERIDPETNLISYGANSIDMVRIGNQLEKEFGFRPRMDQLFRLQTVGALARYFDEHQRERTVSPEVVGSGTEPDLKQLVGSYRVMLDPAEREAFKKSQPGIRRGDDQRDVVELVKPELTEELRRLYQQRRSHRKFSLKPIPFVQFSQFLSCLLQLQIEGKPKYRYASPGGLYPTQVYLHVKPGRVEGITAGAYYYHPVRHQLVELTANVDIDRSIHIPFINTPIFDEAAFSIFLVAQLSAIAPSYGERSIHFVTLEAGLIAQMLETTARGCGLGLCQIGSIDFERIRPLFALEKSHALIHSMLGGMALPDECEEKSETAESGDVEKASKILDRIKQLSKDEVKALLEAHRALNKRPEQ